MKVAVVSDDGRTVSQHFGRAEQYVVLALEDGEVAAREVRPKAGHREFAGSEVPDPGPERKHRAMTDAIADCDALLAGGMGSGAFRALESAGITPVLTDVADVIEAAVRYARGDLPNLADRLHRGRGEHGRGGHQRPDADPR
jgi:predicted Fe-Mo cluster-binding NifX family protein